MHILLIHQAFVTTGEAGGTRHIEFAKRLAAHGHRVTIITSPVSYLSGKNSRSGIYLWKTEKWAEGIEIRETGLSAKSYEDKIDYILADLA